MKKQYITLSITLLIPVLYVVSCYSSGNEPIRNKAGFATKLSSYGLFRGRMAALIPAFHMPKLGTTVLHKEGVVLIKEYIDKIAD